MQSGLPQYTNMSFQGSKQNDEGQSGNFSKFPPLASVDAFRLWSAETDFGFIRIKSRKREENKSFPPHPISLDVSF